MKQVIIIFEFQPINANKILSFKEMIRAYTRFAFLNNNSCIIWTDETVVAVRDNLKTGQGIEDMLFVSQISAPAAWSNSISKNVAEYLVKNLK